MTKLYLAMSEAVAVVAQRPGAGHGAGHGAGDGEWTVDVQLVGSQPQCLAVDRQRPQQVYCGTFDQGLWRSDNAGATWEHMGTSIAQHSVTAVAVSLTERVGAYGVVDAGTEPSALYRSEDGGRTWRELSALRQVPSAPTWGLPDRPAISHGRWITPDPLASGRLFLAIEAGARRLRNVPCLRRAGQRGP